MSGFPIIDDADHTRIRWYKSPIPPERLKELTRRSNGRGLAHAIGHLCLVAALGVVTARFFVLGEWLFFAVSLWAFGLVYSFVPGLATHELSHGTVFRSPRLSRFFLNLYCLLGWTNPWYYKASHSYHHRYTLFRDGDGEAVLPGNPSLRFLWILSQLTFDGKTFLNTVYGFGKLAVTGTFGGLYPREWSEAIFSGRNAPMRTKAVRWARMLLAFHILIFIVSAAVGWWYLPILVSVGPFIANIWRYLIGSTMHTGLSDNVPDWRKCARTVRLDPFSRFLYWNMNFHIEHHMFAAVPCYRLKALHRELSGDMPRPRTVLSAWMEMRRTWRIQKTDPGYQYDTPVPGE